MKNCLYGDKTVHPKFSLHIDISFFNAEVGSIHIFSLHIFPKICYI